MTTADNEVIAVAALQPSLTKDNADQAMGRTVQANVVQPADADSWQRQTAEFQLDPFLFALTEQEVSRADGQEMPDITLDLSGLNANTTGFADDADAGLYVPLGIYSTLSPFEPYAAFAPFIGRPEADADGAPKLGSFISEIAGSARADFISGNDLDNVISGNAGDDVLIGGYGNDTLNGGAGDDTLYGELDNDTITGGDGDDRLFGGRGDDTLDSGAGSYDLRGGRGNDTLDGGAGDDTLSGGDGDDRFVLDLDGGMDIITDFGTGSDKLVISQSLGTESLLADFRISVSNDGTHTTFTYDHDDDNTTADIDIL